jgi:hypothetical protein
MNVMAIKWLPFDLRFNLTHTWRNKLNALCARINRTFKIRQLPSLPAHENPAEHDLYHMYTRIADNVVIMYGNIQKDHAPYIIVCDTTSGQRIRIDLANPRAMSREVIERHVIDIVVDPCEPITSSMVGSIVDHLVTRSITSVCQLRDGLYMHVRRGVPLEQCF